MFLVSIVRNRLNGFLQMIIPGWEIEQVLFFVLLGWVSKMMRGYMKRRGVTGANSRRRKGNVVRVPAPN